MEQKTTTGVKVLIPIYKTTLNRLERMSLQQAYRVLQDYPLVAVKPRGLDLSPLLKEFPRLETEDFDDGYFKGISGYNRLMMSAEFYSRFADVRYVLIYQLDAYVFRDELQLWCGKGYDYVGAPWLVRPLYKFPLFVFTSWLKRKYCEVFHRPNSQQSNFKVGNGGFSLRKVESHLEAVTRLKSVVEHYLAHPGNHIFNEDVFFAVEVNRQGMHFSYPDYREALEFSFDKYPALCYEWNGRRLPFGCHGWYKRKMKKFWFAMLGLQGV